MSVVLYGKQCVRLWERPRRTCSMLMKMSLETSAGRFGRWWFPSSAHCRCPAAVHLRNSSLAASFSEVMVWPASERGEKSDKVRVERKTCFAAARGTYLDQPTVESIQVFSQTGCLRAILALSLESAVYSFTCYLHSAYLSNDVGVSMAIIARAPHLPISDV